MLYRVYNIYRDIHCHTDTVEAIHGCQEDIHLSNYGRYMNFQCTTSCFVITTNVLFFNPIIMDITKYPLYLVIMDW